MRPHRDAPYHALLKERWRLNVAPSAKETYHLALDLGDSGITYAVGDCLAVLPHNDRERVQRTLLALGATGEELAYDPKNRKLLKLRELLTSRVNICDVPQALARLVGERQGGGPLSDLLRPEASSELRAYLQAREVWDFLEEHGVVLPVQEVVSLLAPLLPRFYSIASAMASVGNEAHLTVVEEPYVTNGKERRGVCSHYLCHEVPVGERVAVYVHPSRGFTLPEAHHSIIMVGPGTGVAPFRGFMQERMARGASGRNWLFFGERLRANDFFYGDFWEQLVREERLLLDVAFSRDQAEKVYVQHKMWEKRELLWNWLEEGAYLYICGSASKMAKEVDAVLHRMIQAQGGVGEGEARAYMRALREQRRYLRDVY